MVLKVVLHPHYPFEGGKGGVSSLSLSHYILSKKQNITKINPSSPGVKISVCHWQLAF